MKIGAKQSQGGNRVATIALDDASLFDVRGPAQGKVLRTAAADGMTVTCYDSVIPPFVERALEQRYGSLYSSLATMTAYGGDLAGTSVFLAARGGEIAMLWLFQRRGTQVRVLNESIPVSESELRCFADWIFARFPDVQVITLNCVDPGLQRLGRPLQMDDCSDDSVLHLPPTMDDYLARLGKATRKNVQRYAARLRERFPDFRYTVRFRDEIDAAQIAELVRLNRLRMRLKGKQSGITADEERALLHIARRHGMLLTATIDGRICAGALVFQVRDNYFSFVRTHDPAYNEYRLGLIGACRMIEECIARQGRELHFMWGREPHKAMLKGVEKRLFRLTVYRSRLQLLLNLKLAGANLYHAWHRRFRLWLVDKIQRDDDAVTRLAAGARRVRRRLRGTPQGAE